MSWFNAMDRRAQSTQHWQPQTSNQKLRNIYRRNYHEYHAVLVAMGQCCKHGPKSVKIYLQLGPPKCSKCAHKKNEKNPVQPEIVGRATNALVKRSSSRSIEASLSSKHNGNSAHRSSKCSLKESTLKKSGHPSGSGRGRVNSKKPVSGTKPESRISGTRESSKCGNMK